MKIRASILMLSFAVLTSGFFLVQTHAGQVSLNQEPEVSVNQEPPDVILGGQSNLTRTQCQTATTSPAYLTASTATSTCQAFIGDAREVDFRFMVNSTSTPTTLQYEYKVTNDETLSERNWFLVDGSLDINVLATSTSDLIPYRSYPVTGLSADHLQLNYKVQGGAADVYVEIIKLNEID